MASENLLNGGHRFHGEKSESNLLSSHGENHESSRPSAQTRPMREDRRGYTAPALSRDSGVSSIEHHQVPDSNEMWSSCGPEYSTEESVDTSTFSEEELLDFTFEACNTTGAGEVLASTIMQYLQTMTSQSPEHYRLNALNRMLDPECQDPAISRATFHSTMREWIAQCSQDGMHEDDKHISGENLYKGSIIGMDFSGPEIKTAFSEGEQCICDSRELLATVSELKHAHRRMSKQNNSLLRTVSQGEDTNLQLTVEITELSAKLASAQRSAGRTRSLVEELEEARRALREAQERASRAQASSCKLSKEFDCLKAHIKVLEDKNEQLTLEGTCSEDCLNKLRKVNAEMREELENTLVMLAVRDRELTKKDILMDKLKNSHLENHRIIEGLQSEFMHLSEHSQQALLRFDRHCSSPPGFQGRSGGIPNHRSLHAEIQDIQQRGGLEEMTGPVCGVWSPHTQRDDIQNIIQRIKSAELAHLLHAQYTERDSVGGRAVETLERPYTHSQQPQASIKQQLVNVLKELELQRALWEDREEKVAEQRRLREQQEQRQNPQAKRAAVVNWWRTLKVEGSRTRIRPEDTLTQPSQALTETESKLQQAELTITKIREPLCHLEPALRTAQKGVAEHKNIQDRVGVLHKDKETNTVREGPGWAEEEAAKEHKNVAVATDPVEDPGKSEKVAAQLVTSQGLLVTLRRMEAMVSSALEAAELVRESQRRVSLVKERMESITQKMEEALTRAADTEGQLSALEARITAKPQLPGPIGQTAQPDVEAIGRDRPRNPSPPEPDVEAIGRDRPRNPSPPEPDVEAIGRDRPMNPTPSEPDVEAIGRDRRRNPTPSEPDVEAIGRDRPRNPSPPEPDVEAIGRDRPRNPSPPEPDVEAIGRDRPRNPSPPEPDVEAIGRDRTRNPSPPEPDVEAIGRDRTRNPSPPEPDVEAIGRDRPRNPSPPEPDVEDIGRDRPRNPTPPEPVTESYSKSRWPLISGAIYSRTGGGTNSGSKSCDDSEAPCTDDNKPSQVQCPDFVPDQKHHNTSRDGPAHAFLGSIPGFPSQVFLQYECAPPLTVPPETPPQSACDSHAAAHTEEKVAGLRSEDPSCRDYCQSEARDCGSGQALPSGDCGRSQPLDPGDSARSKASEPENSGRSNALQPTDIGCDLEHCGSFHSRDLPTVLITSSDKEGGGHELYCFPWVQTEQQLGESPTQPIPAESPFFFPLTRPRPPQPPIMPVLPEEEEDSPEELDSSSSSPTTSTPVESRAVTVVMPSPTIVFPKQATVTVVHADGRPLEQTRPHSPRPRLSRNSLGGPITTVDSTGNVIDLVKDRLPELQLSEEDRQKNLELLQEAKKVSDRFLSRRGRKSTCSLSESPTGLSPNHTPSSSPVLSRSSSLITVPQIAVATEVNYAPSSPVSLRLEVLSAREQADTSTPEHESTRKLVDWKPNEKRKVSSGTLAPRYSGPPTPREPSGGQKENCDPRVTAKICPAPVLVNKPEEGLVRAPNQAPATGVAKPVPRPPTQQAPCTAEIKTIGAFPLLMRAVSWDTVGTLNARNGAPSLPPTNEETFSFQDKTRDALLKSSGYKDFPVQPVNVQKLSKIREEHKLMRNQSIVGSKLADLSETAEQERGPSLLPPAGSPTDEEAKEKSDAMPNISDIMLRKLKLHRGLPGCAPPLTEKEVENAFVQLSLAFRNDNYTLETRLKQAERERTLTEENTEKELEEFKGSLKCTAPQWSNMEQRESYQCLIETVAVLHRLALRLSSKAEMVGAVRQEKRMNKATEVMMQYVENLKRTYEKDHAELMEFKKLANQNSSRCYGGSIDTGDDGVPRPSRSMSLTLGKALPRRRVSVAVVPKFNLLNIPGQTLVMAGPGPSVAMGPSPQPTMGQALPVLCEANSMKNNFPTEPTQPAIAESGKSVAEQEAEPSAPAKPPVDLEEIRLEIKAKIEEEAYNKGYQEGLKRSKEVKEVEEEEDEEEDKLEEKPEKKDEEKGKEVSKKNKFSSKVEEVLVVLDRLCPKIFRRNRLLWIVLTLFLVTFLVVNVFTYFSDRYNNHGDMSAEKAMVQGKKKIFGLNVGVQPKNPTPE